VGWNDIVTFQSILSAIFFLNRLVNYAVILFKIWRLHIRIETHVSRILI